MDKKIIQALFFGTGSNKFKISLHSVLGEQEPKAQAHHPAIRFEKDSTNLNLLTVLWLDVRPFYVDSDCIKFCSGSQAGHATPALVKLWMQAVCLGSGSRIL